MINYIIKDSIKIKIFDEYLNDEGENAKILIKLDIIRKGKERKLKKKMGENEPR